MAVHVARVAGVRETIRVLRLVEPQLARAAIKHMKAPAQAAAQELKAVAPHKPLSNMRPSGAVLAGVKYGGRKRQSNNTLNVVSVVLKKPGKWTVASDMARFDAPGQTMSSNLMNKYGGPSRWAWPTVEKHQPQMTAAILVAIREVELVANDALRKYGR